MKNACGSSIAIAIGLQEVAVIERLEAEELEVEVALGLESSRDPAEVEAGQFRIEQFGSDAGLHVGREIFGIAHSHIGLRGEGRPGMDIGQHLAAELVQQQARTDIGVVRLLLDQRARGHDRGQRQFVLADAVVEIAGGLGEHGCRGDAVETGAGFADNQRKPLGVETNARTVGERDMKCRRDSGRRFRGRLLGALARPLLAVQHIGACDLVVLAPHQGELDLVLHVLDMEGASLACPPHQRSDDFGRQLLHALMDAARGDRAGAFDRKKRLGHGDRDLGGIERRDLAVATDDLHGRLARSRRKRLWTQMNDGCGSGVRVVQVE